jgi:hypothetical protein
MSTADLASPTPADYQSNLTKNRDAALAAGIGYGLISS